jgi:hypothetical protein
VEEAVPTQATMASAAAVAAEQVASVKVGTR